MAVIRKESLAEKGDSPVLCYNCSAALSAISKTHQGQNIIMWICEFCDHPNCMNPATVPSRPLNDAVYALEWQRDRVDVEDALIVFCVDISGSMSVTSEVKGSKERSRSEHVSRLQCVKNGIMKSLQFLRQQSPRARVGLVTFNDEVTVFGGGLSSPLTLTDYELMDLDYLQERGRLYPTPQSIAETMSSLSRRVNEMIGCGATALGPAAVIAIEMAAKQVGSKVIVCTDGLANTGLGFLDSMEDELCESGSYFYTHLSETASTLGVVVSVLTFEGTDCRLAEVGKLADRTGGRVEIVNPGSLSHELQSILEDDVMATNMTLQFYVAKDMYFRYEEQVGNKLVREIGNVTKDAEITFEFGIKEADPSTIQQKRETFPFQLQADFTTRDQRRVRRIISHEKYITMNRAFVEDSINVMVLGVHAAQLSARLTMERRGGEAQRGVQAHTSLIRDIVEKKQNKEEEDIYENWMGAVASICEDAMGPCELEGDAGNIDSTVTVHGSALKGFSDEMMNAIFRMKNAKTKMLRKSNKTKN
ncbi:circularly permutated Ras protein 1-like [Ambystoma mexicanum]|uniref:circularly permutated Ras protein 1-like n=1 Tax=Ambystoma mexicanum TaxID=8296 RepID=UPI0037E80FC1